MSRRSVVWVIVLAAILGLGWRKAEVNRRDMDRQVAWQQRLAELNVKSREEYEDLHTWSNQLDSHPNPRSEVESKLNSGKPLPTQREQGFEVFHWSHPEFGIYLTFDFEGNQIVSRGMRYGSPPLTQPARQGITGLAEQVRQLIVRYARWLWFAALGLALFSHRYGLVAAEVMLGTSLAFGAACLVSPLYSITVQGVFSNNSLAMAAILYVTSLLVLAHRAADVLVVRGSQAPMRFNLRTALIVTAVVAALLALGPFGYFAICVFVPGLAILGIMMRRRLARIAPRPRVYG